MAKNCVTLVLHTHTCTHTQNNTSNKSRHLKHLARFKYYLGVKKTDFY